MLAFNFDQESSLINRPKLTLEMTHKKLHSTLAHYNINRLSPAIVNNDWVGTIEQNKAIFIKEGHFVEKERQHVQQYLVHMPTDATAFMQWFNNLKQEAPGQGDALFPWLATTATLEEMRWFLQQEAAGEAGFDDMVAMTQVKLPPQAKLEMARNYWDEMGRGHLNSMHGLMLERTVHDLKLTSTIDDTIWESLALANLMMALSTNRRYAYQSVGALGAIEMTAPTRVGFVNEGLKRLGVSFETRKYFQLHATLDIKHSLAWNTEVIQTLVANKPETAKPIAEGALMRLCSGARTYDKYKAHFGFRENLH